MRYLSIHLDLDRFDQIVLSVVLVLGVATGLVLLRGDRVGVQVSDLVPAPGSTEVSTRTEVRLTFDAPMDKASVIHHFHIAPALEGELSWRGKTLIWRPREGLTANSHHTVTLEAGASSSQGRHLLKDLTWTFHTGHPRVLFMSVGEVSHLYQIETNGLNVRQLTWFEDGSSVWDYAVSPDGSRIVLGLVRPDASAVDLWLMGRDGKDAQLLLA